MSMPSSATMSPAMAHADGYHRWVFSSFARHVSAGTVLEVGSGHGRYARLLAGRAARVIVSDIDPRAVESLRSELGGLPNIEYRVMDGVDRKIVGTEVDAILLVNVLEHIADDAAVLRACHETLRPGGCVAIFVPAFPALYATMDAEAGHHRRYRRRELREKLTAAGFAIEELRFFNAVGFAGWLANKWLGSKLAGTGTNVQISLFDKLVPVIRLVDPAIPFLGQSLVAVGRRPGTPC
jgi:SAM-dependent methyltransferase